MSFICNQVRKAHIVIIRLIRVCGYWIGKLCSPRKEAVEQDEGTALLLSMPLCREIKKSEMIPVKLPKLQSL